MGWGMGGGVELGDASVFVFFYAWGGGGAGGGGGGGTLIVFDTWWV